MKAKTNLELFKTLIRLNIIPSRYSQMQLKDFYEDY